MVSPWHFSNAGGFAHSHLGRDFGPAAGGRQRSYARAPSPSPRKIKAALVFNFAKFVEWPAEALPTKPRPGSLACSPKKGKTLSRNHLEQTIRGKR